MSDADDRPEKPSGAGGSWVARAMRLQAMTSPGAAATMILLCLALCWVAGHAAGGSAHLAPDWFYIPIFFAGTRFGLRGAAVAALLAGVLAGPLTPVDVNLHIAAGPGEWITRTILFAGIGVLMASVVARLQESRAKELRLATKERDLAIQKAAVIQAVSHEFRTPLTILSGSIRTLEQHDLVTDAGRPLVGGLTRAVERMDDLIAAMLAAGGALDDRRHGEQRPVELRQVCDKITRGLARHDAPTRVGFEAFPDAQVILSSPAVITLLLRFVTENALKFSPPHSPVLVLARRVDDVVEIRVRDWGKGISDEFIGRAFEAFTQEDATTTRRHGGLGIGLYAAQNLVERLGGSIRLRRHPGGGTEAVVSIPQRRAEDVAVQEAATRPVEELFAEVEADASASDGLRIGLSS